MFTYTNIDVDIICVCVYVYFVILNSGTCITAEQQRLRIKHKDLTKVHESMRDAFKEHLTFRKQRFKDNSKVS